MRDAVESAHMGHPDFRANGKIFATLHADDRHGMVKLTPDQQREFIRAHPEAFTPENGAWGRQGCTRVVLAKVDEDTLGEATTQAWQNSSGRRSTRPKKSRKSRSRRRKG